MKIFKSSILKEKATQETIHSLNCLAIFQFIMFKKINFRCRLHV